MSVVKAALVQTAWTGDKDSMIGRIERARGKAVRCVVPGEEVVTTVLLVVLRLRAHVEHLVSQRDVRRRHIVASVELLIRHNTFVRTIPGM